MFQVLYVDDEVELLDIAQLYLGDSGDFTIHISTSAEDVLKSGNIQSYDAIISDYQMPGMDGITFLKEVRSQYGDNIPFILFTGRGREEVVIEALNAGADFYLQKGGDPEAQFTELAHKVKIAIEHRRYEGDLFRSEQRYRHVVEDQTEFISRFSPDGTHVFVNDAYCRYFGVSRDEILGKKFKPAIPAEDAPQVADFFRSLTVDNPAGTIDHRILMPDGRIRWQRWNDRAIFDPSGNLVEYQSVGRDITEQKGIELALQESEKKFRDIFNSANDAIRIHGIDEKGLAGKFIEVNDVACRMLQYSRMEYLDKNPLDLVTPDNRTLLTGIMEEVSRVGHIIFETVHVRKDGTLVPVEVSAHSTSLNGKPVVVSVARDISERKKAEHELLASEKFNREVISHAKEGIIVYDRELRILLWNPFMEDLTGIPATEVLGKNTVEQFPFIRKAGVADLLENALSGNTGESQDFEFSFPSTGKHGWVKGIYSPQYDADGNIVGVIGIVRDITRRKQAELTLMESEERFRTQYENNPLAIFTWQKKGDDFILTGYNTEAENITKGKVSTLLGSSAGSLYSSRPEILADLWKCYTEKTTVSSEIISQNFIPGRYIRNTGAYIPPDMVLVHMEDITGQKQYEARILRERENFFRILSTAPVGLVLINHERMITEANRYFGSLVFREPAEIIGKRAGGGIGCVHSTEDPRGCGFSDSCPECPLRNGIDRVLTRGERLNGEVIELTLQIDGTPQQRWLSINAEPIDLDGERYSIVSVDDITPHMEYEQERIRKSEELTAAYEQIAATEEELRQNYDELAESQRLLQTSEYYLRSVVDGSPIPTFVIDRDHRITSWNNALAEYLGIPAEQVLGKPLAGQAFYKADRPSLADLIVDQAFDDIADWYGGRFTKSASIKGAYEVTDFFPGMKEGVWLFFTASPLYDSQGALVGAVETLQDVTGQKRAEEELSGANEELHAAYEELSATEDELRRNLEAINTSHTALAENEKNYRLLFENLTSGFALHEIVTDSHNTPVDYRFIAVNPAFEEQTGLKGQDLIGRTVRETLPGIESYWIERYGAVALTGQPVSFENYSADLGKWYSVLAYSPVPRQFAVIVTDITDRKKSEEILQESEAQVRSIFENSVAGIFQTSPDGTLIHANDAFARMYGYPHASAMIGTGVNVGRDLYTDPKERELVVQSLKETGLFEPREFSVRKCDGTRFWVAVTARAVCDSNGTLRYFEGVCVDITKMKQAEEISREKTEEMDRFFTNSLDLLCIADTQGYLRKLNPEWERALGYTLPELENQRMFDFIHPDDLEATRATLTRSDRQEILNFVNRYRHKDGSYRWIEWRSFPHGNYIYATARDITLRKAAEDSLKESEERFRSLVNELQDGVIILGFDGILKFGNPAAFQMVGIYPSSTDHPINIREFIDPGSLSQVMADLKTIQDNGEGPLSKYRICTATGEKKWAEVIGTRINYQGSPADLVAIRDITDREEAERALTSANKKLQLLGSITRHDIRNKITVSLGYITMIRKKSTDPVVQEYIAKLESANRAIGSQIDFTRVYQDIGTHEPQWQDLDTLLPRSHVPRTIEFRVDIAGIAIFSDPMLEKVFFNLLDNSIRHGEHVREISVRAIPSGDILTIIWKDDGIGIPEEEKERIFDQDFGKNTGLGMFLSREILSLTGISIQETGEPGEGATFEITVPKGAWRMATKPGTPGRTR